MRNVLFIFSLVLCGTQCVTAQNEPRFYAEANATEVAIGQPINVSFILESGKNNGRITLPDWEAAGFMLLGSSQSSSVSITNGVRTASASYHFSITPIKTGTLTIPAASIKNGDSELFTEPITIQVLTNADDISPAPAKPSPAQPKSEPKRKFKTIKM